jgi:DNA-binding beta-propeller fold protein YncE
VGEEKPTQILGDQMKLGIRVVSNGLVIVAAAGLLAAPRASDARGGGHAGHGRYFERVATLPVFLNTEIDEETVSEIVAATEDGRTLVYTDSAQEKIGFVEITDPLAPVADGTVDVGGEPTSVAVRGEWALVAVNTSETYTNPSGVLQVVAIATRTIVRTIDLGGQPDSIAISPDGQYAAIAIENERDEDAGDGRPPQSPPGFLVVVDLVGGPASWGIRQVELVGLAERFPEDPEPEFVSVNEKNIAVVTLQESNHIVLVELSTGDVVRHFSAGTVDLRKVDILENDLIHQVDSLDGVPREPDGVVWISSRRFATADEGDLDGGSRGVTVPAGATVGRGIVGRASSSMSPSSASGRPRGAGAHRTLRHRRR